MPVRFCPGNVFTGFVYKHLRPEDDNASLYVLVLGRDRTHDKRWWVLTDMGEIKSWFLIEGCRKLVE